MQWTEHVLSILDSFTEFSIRWGVKTVRVRSGGRDGCDEEGGDGGDVHRLTIITPPATIDIDRPLGRVCSGWLKVEPVRGSIKARRRVSALWVMVRATPLSASELESCKRCVCSQWVVEEDERRTRRIKEGEVMAIWENSNPLEIESQQTVYCGGVKRGRGGVHSNTPTPPHTK
jgi:hypothetical protein